MSHAFTLALVYALILQAASLLHAAAAGWAATRQVTLEPLALIGAPVAAAVGMALLVDAVTAALGIAPAIAFGGERVPRLAGIFGLGAVALLLMARLLHETSRLGRNWRAMGANAKGLVAIGVPVRLALPTLLGLALAAFAGLLAVPPDPTNWLPLACLALMALALPDRPPGRATLGVLLAWLAGALVGGLAFVFGPELRMLMVATAALLAARFVVPHLVRQSVG
jgi:hypothetical protein